MKDDRSAPEPTAQDLAVLLDLLSQALMGR